MAGSPDIQLVPKPPEGPRAALVIATSSYQDPELRQLRAPAHDAEDLAEVLADPRIGAFTVTRVIDQDERRVQRKIDVFLSSRGLGDLVVVYLSCHGLLDRRGRLYFAAADTAKNQLGSTGILSAWLLDQLDDCRARRQVLILDCCFSGAFARGSKGVADLDLERPGTAVAARCWLLLGPASTPSRDRPCRTRELPDRYSPPGWSRDCAPATPMLVATGT